MAEIENPPISGDSKANFGREGYMNSNSSVPDDFRVAQLQERLAAYGQGQSEMRSTITSFISKTEERFNSFGTQLDTKLTALAANFGSQLTSLNASLAERSKTPWNNIIGACGVTIALLSGLMTLVVVPIFGSIAEIKTNQKESFREMAAVVRDVNSGAEKSLDRVRERFDTDIRDLREGQVSRKEHEKDWSAQARHDTDVQRQISEIRETVNGLYSAKDIIRRLERDVDELRNSDRPRKNG
jgi:hypothetical protein